MSPTTELVFRGFQRIFFLLGQSCGKQLKYYTLRLYYFYWSVKKVWKNEGNTSVHLTQVSDCETAAQCREELVVHTQPLANERNG